jgi:arylsulfatase A-like enzyme
LGFDHWKVLECTHEYYNSKYYADDDPTSRTWQGYDAYAQTDAMIEFLRNGRSEEKPFAAFLSWGPPHAPPPYQHDSPYDQFPPELADAYPPDQLSIPGNVPEEHAGIAARLLSGYYAHCTALDNAFGRILDCLEDLSLTEETIVVFTSDHGDMLGSQGLYKKQSPFAESVDIPLLMRVPGIAPGVRPELMIEPEDMMPTLLSLCDVPTPNTVEGVDCSPAIRGEEETIRTAAFLALYVPNGQWRKGMDGGPHGYTGREYRGVKSSRFSYIRDRSGPWLLFDNQMDPLQLNNLIDDPNFSDARQGLDDELSRRLDERSDTFEEGVDYIARWGYEVDEYNAVRFSV